MRYVLSGLAAIFLTMFLDTLAHAQEGPPCAPTEALFTELRKQFGETITGAGVMKDGSYVVITTNSQTQSFTILLRRPDGMSCILTAGRGFAMGDPEATEKGDRL